jgi:hypothetical protein
VHRASTARAKVAAWWDRWPAANVAVATGAIVVLDVDGADGARSLQDLEAKYQRLPDTAWVSTARGRHLYFLALGLEIGNSAGRVGSGLDIRGRGGFVVARRACTTPAGATAGTTSTSALPPCRHGSPSHCDPPGAWSPRSSFARLLATRTCAPL